MFVKFNWVNWKAFLVFLDDDFGLQINIA